MNFQVSYNWLKEYLKTARPAEEFSQKLSLAGPTVEKIVSLEKQFSKVVVGELVEKKPHPKADRLFLGQVDIGKKTIKLVFGDTVEVEQGTRLPVALPGTILPNGQEIKETTIRGEKSQGMFCLDSELGISEQNKIFRFDKKIKPGTPITKALKFLKDEIIDLEITSNRPDLASVVGLAREAAAILEEKFLFERPVPNLKTEKKEKLAVTNKESKICPRYQAVLMTGATVEPSPIWLQQRLIAAGLRPINNLVDITNYILKEFGQPMHVFDVDKLNGREIKIRLAKKGEKILALDEKTYQLNPDDLVIADRRGPAAIAGIIGGQESSVNEKTKTIVFEAANFDPVSVRKTSRRLNLATDSSSLFEKGLEPENTELAILRAIELARELANAKPTSEIFDLNHSQTAVAKVSLTPEEVEKTLGTAITEEKITTILKRLGFQPDKKEKQVFEAPWWRRRDISGPHDLIEEIARIYGYQNFPTNLPAGELPVEIKNEDSRIFFWEDRIKNILAGLGFSEARNYSFSSEKNIKNCSLNLEQAIKIANPLNLDFQYLRVSLTPGLLENVAENQNFFQDLRIFELSKVYLTQGKLELPEEKTFLTIVFSSREEGSPFLEVKGALEALFEKLNIENFSLKPLEKEEFFWNRSKTGEITIGGEVVGRLGEINQEILYLFRIKQPVAIGEIDFSKLIKFARTTPIYHPIPKFPGIELDLSMEISKKIRYRQVAETIKEISPLVETVLFLSVFSGRKIPAGQKALAVRIIYRDPETTLTLEQVKEIHQKIVKKLKKEYNIKVR